MIEFWARYKDPKSPFDLASAGVEPIKGSSKTELLRQAYALRPPGCWLALITIRAWGSSNMIWNAQRAAKNSGNGWYDKTLNIYFPNGGFPEE